jgi:hypothetical protein
MHTGNCKRNAECAHREDDDDLLLVSFLLECI